MKRLYLIGGPMGVGKTTVCQILKRELPRCVFLDGDWCWDASPFQVTEETKAMVLDNIGYLLTQFLHCSAYEHIVFCWVMDQQEILQAILNRLDTTSCQVRLLSLTADAPTLRQRLQGDVAQGLRTPDVVARSLARIPRYAQLNTEKVDTTGKTVEEVAREILAGDLPCMGGEEKI